MKLISGFTILLLSGIFISGQEKKSGQPEIVMQEIFPDTKIEIKNIILSPDEISETKKLSGMKQEEKLVSFYLAKNGEQIIGYGYADIHYVRTHPEVVLYAINPSGEIVKVEVLSFKEPPEYKPSEKWLNLFKGKSMEKNTLLLRKDIDAISGATLTARAVTNHSRKALALWKIIFENKK